MEFIGTLQKSRFWWVKVNIETLNPKPSMLPAPLKPCWPYLGPVQSPNSGAAESYLLDRVRNRDLLQ